MLQNSITKNKSTSQNEKINYFRNLLVQNIIIKAQGISPMQQLKIIYDKNDSKDICELRDILSKNLCYPSSQIAQVHARANRLGNVDIKNNQNINNYNETIKYCPCCGAIQQLQTINLLTSIQDVNNIGVSTSLYFFTLKNLIILLFVMFLVFSAYAIESNLNASIRYKSYLGKRKIKQQSTITYQGMLIYSLGSKAIFKNQYSIDSFQIQCWLGVVFVAIWGFLFILIQYMERVVQHFADQNSKTAADYTLVFQNMPKNITKNQLQTQLRQYQKTVKLVYNSHLTQKQIKISKINQAMPFYLDQSNFSNKQLKKINKQYEECLQKFMDWIKERQKHSKFSISQDQRNKIYQTFNYIKTKKIEKMKQIIEQILKTKKHDQNYIEKVPTFVTFENSYNKQFLQKMHDGQNYKWLFKLPFFNKRIYYHYDHKKQTAIIKKAPEPQDIIWTNLGQDKCKLILKKIFSFLISVIIVCCTFAIIFGLKSAKHQLLTKTKSRLNPFYRNFLNIAFSIILTLINLILKYILIFLTSLQKNASSTYYQASLGVKGTFFIILNSIFVPILVYRIFILNFYGIDGLSDNIFYFSITTSFFDPLLKIFDAYYYFTRIIKWYYNKPNKKLELDQIQLNTKFQYIQFQIGFEYIYVINLFIFTCFFVSLQPIIPLFTIGGFVLMYWAQKYSLFQRCKRPLPGNNFINSSMYQFIYAGPLFYSLGSFCWSNILDTMPSGFTPNLISLIISIIILIVPYRQIVKALMKQFIYSQQIFQDNRIFLPSQYDRLNPNTAKQGIKQYKNYIQNYEKQLKNKSIEEIQKLQKQFALQNRNINRSSISRQSRFSRNLKDFNMYMQYMGGLQSNIVNPLLICDAILNKKNKTQHFRPRKRQTLAMIVQNWLTSEELMKHSYGLNSIIHQLKQTKSLYEKNKQQNNNDKVISDNNSMLSIILDESIINLASVKENYIENRSSQNFKYNEIPLNLGINLYGNLIAKFDKNQN